MAQTLLKTGLLLISIALIFIAIGFIVFAIFSIALILPGFLLYNLGLKQRIDEISSNNSEDAEIYDENGMKVISGKALNQNPNIIDKVKLSFKKMLKKVTLFLNKYTD